MLLQNLLLLYPPLILGYSSPANLGGKEKRETRNLQSGGVHIKLATDLEPQIIRGNSRLQSELMEDWTRDNGVARDKRFRLGSNETVMFGKDKGFFSTVQAAYNNHWVLKTRPEDWWTAISQTLATKIDKHAKDPLVKNFFVSHEGKKKLTVNIGRSVRGINNERFFQSMISKITENINKPEYTTVMASDFSQSTSVDRVVSSIMLMFSFQEYFEYRSVTFCGIPGVTMLGSEDDWRSLIDKLKRVEQLLKPIEQVLQLGDWFRSSGAVLKNLLETYQGNPDRDWWSRIMDIRTRFGSGGGTQLSGWFVTDFLGLYTGSVGEVPSGVNVVPLTITNGYIEEQAALVAGVTGYTVSQEISQDNINYPSVQSELGWGLLMEQNSVFN